jgi:hypothetical protein
MQRTTPHLTLRAQRLFWKKVDCSGGINACWIWIASGRPYGLYRFKDESFLVHRLAWRLYNGPIPGGMVVRHRCHTSLCVNPNHLMLGVQRDNIRDQIERGTFVRGTANGMAKLTDDDVRDIITRYARNEPLRSIARRYKISQVTASEIGRRVTWQHIDAVTPPSRERRTEGVGNGNHRLSADDVRAIRSRYPKENMPTLAKAYGVSLQTISAIVHRRTWSWLD